MNNDELNRLVCERVLGWRTADAGGGQRWWFPPNGSSVPTPDFCNDWTAFGVLWEALVKIMHEVHLCRYEDGVIEAMVLTEQGISQQVDPDPRRALALAALKAYSVEVE